MKQKEFRSILGTVFLWIALLGIVALIVNAFYQKSAFHLLIALPVILVTALAYDRFQSKHAVLRNYPLIGL
jgi:FtsH-binding integral membrane protein